MTLLRRVCAYCGMDMGIKDGQGVSGVTHGICDSCLERETRAVLDVMQVQREIAVRREKDA